MSLGKMPMRVGLAAIGEAFQAAQTPDEVDLCAFDRANCERHEQRIDDALEAFWETAVARMSKLPDAEQSAIRRDYDRLTAEVREASAARALSQANFILHAGYASERAARTFQHQVAKRLRTAKAKKRSMSKAEKIVRTVRAEYAHLLPLKPWSEAVSIETEVNKRRRNRSMKRVSPEAIQKIIERIDRTR